MALLLGLGLLSERPEVLENRVREVLAQELSRFSDRQVQIGAVSGTLLTGLRIDHFALADERGFPEGVLIAARQVTLKYDLPGLIFRRLKPTEAVEEITVDQAYVRLERSPTGEINLVRLFADKFPRRRPGEERFHPRVRWRDCVVDITAAGLGSRTLRTRLTSVSGTADLTPLGPLYLELRSRSADGAFGALAVRVQTDPDQHYVLAEGRLEGLPLGRWAALLGLPGPVRLTSGSATGDFQIWSVPRAGAVTGPSALPVPSDPAPPPPRLELGYSAQIAVREVALGLPPEAGGEARLSRALLQVTPQGVEVQDLAGSWQGMPLVASGWLYDFADLQADLRVAASQVDLAALRRRLPPDLATDLPLDLAGSADVTADLIGPLEHLNADLSLELPQGGVLRTEQTGEVFLGSTTVKATLWDSGAPAVLVDLDTLEAAVPGPLLLASPGESPAASQPVPLVLEQVGSVRAQALYAGGTPLVSAAVAGVAGSYEGAAFSSVSADLTLAGGLLRVPRLEAETLGGRVQAEALVVLAPEPGAGPRVHARGRLEEVQLANVPRSLLEDRPDNLHGTLTSDFSLLWQDGRGHAVGSLQIADGAYDEYLVDRLETLVALDYRARGDWLAYLPLATVRSPAGEFTVTGTAAGYGPLDLTLDFGALELAALPIEGERPAGAAYGQLRLTGTLEAPVVSGQAVVFRPRYQDYEASAVVADFRARTRSLEVADLYPPLEGEVLAYASYDSAVAEADLQLTAAAVTDQPPGLAGTVRLSGLRTESLPKLLGERWPEELATLTGLAQVQATVRGTTAAPVAEGLLALSHLDYRRFHVNAVRAPFVFAPTSRGPDQLVVRGGTLSTEGATLTFDGSAQDLFEEWRFEARAQARDLHLERLTASLPVRLPLAGEAFIPAITIRGSAEGLIGDGRLLAPEVTVGDSLVRGVDTHFLIDQDHVHLERTTLEAAGGRLQAELTYTLAERSLAGTVEATDLDVSRALALAAPLVAATEEAEADHFTTERTWRRWSLRSQGLLTTTVQFAGPVDKLAGTVRLGLTEAAYEDKPVPDVLGGFAFETSRRELTDLDLEVRSGQALMIVSGRADLDGDLAIVADASNVDLASWRDWLPRELGLGGIAGVTIQAEGTTQSPEITASVDIMSASLRGVGFDLVSIPVVTVNEGGIDLDRIIFKRGERQVLASGHLPFSWHPVSLPRDEPVSFLASLERTDLGFFLPIINELSRYSRRAGPAQAPSPWLQMTATGSVDSRLKVSGTLGHPVLEGYLSIAEGTVNRSGWPHPITELTADLTIRSAGERNRVEVTGIAARWDQTRLALTGSSLLSTLDPAHLERNQYDMTLSLAADNQVLWTGQTLDSLRGAVTLSTEPDGAQRLRFADLVGKFGAGTLSLDGSAQLSDFRPAALARNAFDVTLTAAQVPVSYPNTMQAVLEGALRVSNPLANQPAVVSGVLTLDKGHLGLPQSAAGRGAGGPLTGLGPGVPDFGLDVRVAIGPDFALRTPALVAPFVPTSTAALAQGSLLAPRIRGGLQTEPMAGSLPGTSFSLRSMTISYQLAPVEPRTQLPYALALTGGYHGVAEQTLPFVQVEGRSIGQVQLTMTIDNDFADPERGTVIRVTAEPALTQEQIAILIGLAGLVPGGTTDVDELLSQRFVSILGRGFREALFNPLEAQVRRALGLTEFTVLFSFGQPLEVRMTKYLAKNFLVTYRYSLIGSRNEQWNLGISYDLPGGIRVTYGTDERETTQFRVSRGWTF